MQPLFFILTWTIINDQHLMLDAIFPDLLLPSVLII